MRTDRGTPVVRAVKGLGRLLDFLVVAGVTLLALIGLYALWDSNRIYYAASPERYEVYRPAAEEDSPGFEKLRAINEDVIGWITEYGTSINYPVLQGEDNFEYLNRSAEGKYSLAGAIFLDSRNSRDFRDPVSVIYGHHMSHDAMFGDIDRFKEPGFLAGHRFGTLYYGGKTWGLENFAYLETDAYDSTVYCPEAEAEELPELFETLRTRAVQYLETTSAETDRVVLLSTCAVGDTDARQILAARLVEETAENPYPEERQKKKQSAAAVGTIRGEWRQAPVQIWLLILALFVFSAAMTAGKIFRRKQTEQTEGKGKTCW